MLHSSRKHVWIFYLDCSYVHLLSIALSLCRISTSCTGSNSSVKSKKQKTHSGSSRRYLTAFTETKLAFRWEEGFLLYLRQLCCLVLFFGFFRILSRGTRLLPCIHT